MYSFFRTLRLRLSTVCVACLVTTLIACDSIAQRTRSEASRPIAPEPLDLVPEPMRSFTDESPYDPFPRESMGPLDSGGRTTFSKATISAESSDSPMFSLPAPQTESILAESSVQYPVGPITPVVDPTKMVEAIHDELENAAKRESNQFDTIQQGLRQLRQVTETLRGQAKEDEKRLETERRRARRAEQLADDARQQAERARIAAEESLRRMQELSVRSETDNSLPTRPIDSESEGHANTDSQTQQNGDDQQLPEPVTSRRLPTAVPVASSVIPLTDNAVDREALANNLFGAGQYKLALQVYVQLAEQSSAAEDQAWFEYQVACCYRNLGDIAQAEKYYRIVAARKASYLAATARWYLSMLQDEKALKQQMASWNAALGTPDQQGHPTE